MSLRDDALATLSAWSAPTPTQELLRLRLVEHLHLHEDATSRSCFPDHLTAGVIVLDPTGEQVLLNLHRKAGRWFAFGGHCEDGDASLADVARREAHEESGLAELSLRTVPVHLDVHAVDFCDPRGTVHHLDVRYAALAPAAASYAASEESLAVRWWPVGALPGLGLEPEMHELVALARAVLC